MSLSDKELKELQPQIKKEVERRLADSTDARFQFIDELVSREKFGRVIHRADVLRYIVAAKGLKRFRNHSLLDVIRSYYVGKDRSPSAAKSMQEALRKALDHSRDDGDVHQFVITKLDNQRYVLTIYPDDRHAPRPWALSIEPMRPPRPASDEPLTRRFWGPHLLSLSEIAFGLPLFVRSGDGEARTYTRHVARNQPSQVDSGEASFAFVTVGDVFCMLRVMGWLQLREATLAAHAYDHSTTYNELKEKVDNAANVVVIGSPRVCGLISAYQDRLGRDPALRQLTFKVEILHVTNALSAREPVLSDRYIDGGFVEAVVVVTRRPGGEEGSITMIAANHGRAVERIGEVLTDEDQITNLFTHSKLKGWKNLDSFPPCFQLLLSVRVHDRIRVTEPPVVKDVWIEKPER